MIEPSHSVSPRTNSSAQARHATSNYLTTSPQTHDSSSLEILDLYGGTDNPLGYNSHYWPAAPLHSHDSYDDELVLRDEEVVDYNRDFPQQYLTEIGHSNLPVSTPQPSFGQAPTYLQPPLMLRWSAEQSTEERLRLGLPRYESEQYKATIDYEVRRKAESGSSIVTQMIRPGSQEERSSLQISASSNEIWKSQDNISSDTEDDLSLDSEDFFEGFADVDSSQL